MATTMPVPSVLIHDAPPAISIWNVMSPRFSCSRTGCRPAAAEPPVAKEPAILFERSSAKSNESTAERSE